MAGHPHPITKNVILNAAKNLLSASFTHLSFFANAQNDSAFSNTDTAWEFTNCLFYFVVLADNSCQSGQY